MTATEQRERIKAMLARYRDALHAGSQGTSREAHDSRILLFGPIYTRKATKKGWVASPAGFRLEERRNRDARKERAELGVDWIAQHYHWTNIHLESLDVACGDKQPKGRKPQDKPRLKALGAWAA